VSDDIINAIRLLVEDGAEVTYTKETQQPTDYYQGVLAGRLTERERIIQLVKAEIPLILQDRFIELIKGEQE
jgi:hypothetical protein